MAAAQAKSSKPNMFRRMLSPRVKADKPSNCDSRSFDASVEIENLDYRNPEDLHPQNPPGPVRIVDKGRTQSMVTTPTDNPPLPPRNNRPFSFSSNHPLNRRQSNEKPKAQDDNALYMEPANTLRRTDISNYSQVETHDAVTTRQDLKQISTHKQTMEQKQSRGHRRVRSSGHVIDQSEYSTPFDLLQQNAEAKRRGEPVLPSYVQAQLPTRSYSDKPPPKPPTVRKKIPQQQLESGDPADSRIPILSPSPPIITDRVHSNSPSSPGSDHSSEQELIRDDGTNDYDDPWDQRFTSLNMPSRNRASTGQTDIRPHHRNTQFSQSQRVESSGFNERVSPSSPVPLDRPRRPARERGEPSSISPEPPTHTAPPFSHGAPGRNSGRRQGTGSPHPPRDIRSFSTNQVPTSYSPRFDHPEPRSGSVSMLNRMLPPTPRDQERRLLNRESSPPPPPSYIDVSIPLEDQPWYHGNITRAQAEHILAEQPDFSFLVRNSESSNTNYSLSIRDYSSGFIHLRVILKVGSTPGYVLGQFSGHFNAVQECISFYTTEKLNIRGAEHKKLGLPIPRANTVTRYRM